MSHSDIGSVDQIYDGTLLPDIQVNTLRNIDRLFPTRIVRRGAKVYPLPASSKPLGDVKFSSLGRDCDLYDYVSLNRVSGLLVIKSGKVAFETYQLGNSSETRWASMSMAKSITATLVGAAIKDGSIKGIDDQITRYLPRLADTAYDGATVRHLLQMTSGLQWNESYTDPQSDRRRMLAAQNNQQAASIVELMAKLPRAAEPGTRWNYSTGETHVVGALLRAAVGRPLAEYLSDKIWRKFGMESDALWWLESPDGLEVGGSGLSAALRDYGRFGLFLLGGGWAGGEGVLPDGWIEEASSTKIVNGTRVDYGYMLWPITSGSDRINDGAFEARGIFGQHIYMNPRESVVIAVWSAQPKATDKATVDDVDFFAAVSRALR